MKLLNYDKCKKWEIFFVVSKVIESAGFYYSKIWDQGSNFSHETAKLAAGVLDTTKEYFERQLGLHNIY